MNTVMINTLAFIAGVKNRFLGEEKGATAVEYGIMVALIAVVIITSVALFGKNLSTVFTNIAGELTKVRP